jgi:hypothetical protein
MQISEAPANKHAMLPSTLSLKRERVQKGDECRIRLDRESATLERV